MSDSTEIFNYLNVEDGASSNGAVNSIAPSMNSAAQIEEVTKPHGNENKQEPKAGQNPPKVSPNYKPQQAMVTPISEPREYIGVVICKRHKRIKYLGTVVEYNDDKKWFRIEYDEGGSEDMVMNEVCNNLASFKDLGCPPLPSARSSSKRTVGVKKKKKKKPASRNGSTRGRKRKNTSSSRNADAPYVPLALKKTKKDDYWFYGR